MFGQTHTLTLDKVACVGFFFMAFVTTLTLIVMEMLSSASPYEKCCKTG